MSNAHVWLGDVELGGVRSLQIEYSVNSPTVTRIELYGEVETRYDPATGRLDLHLGLGRPVMRTTSDRPLRGILIREEEP